MSAHAEKGKEIYIKYTYKYRRSHMLKYRETERRERERAGEDRERRRGERERRRGERGSKDREEGYTCTHTEES